MNIAYNMDCMEAMRQMPDKAFDLAVVDPPYGINFGEFNRTNKTADGYRYKSNKYHNARWDVSVPEEEYFTELFRVSKGQIIWGGNYYNLPPCKEFIFWFKRNPVSNFSDGEFAWTSFGGVAKCFDYAYYGNINSETERIHPTQKPVALYAWIYKLYAKPGMKILDTHLGSGSSRIAAYDAGLDFTGYEIDPTYFKLQEERFARHIAQTNLFLEEGL